jgi:hypothetical protein
MTKKPSKRTAAADVMITQATDPLAAQQDEPVNEPPVTMRVNSFTDLATMREQASRRRNTTANTIAELVEWRSEIDATIAYLRAQEK